MSYVIRVNDGSKSFRYWTGEEGWWSLRLDQAKKYETAEKASRVAPVLLQVMEIADGDDEGLQQGQRARVDVGQAGLDQQGLDECAEGHQEKAG